MTLFANRSKWCLPMLLCWALLAACQATAQQPELIVEIEKQEIYEGESVLYRVTLNHVDQPVEPELPGFTDFLVAKLGEQSLDSQQITIINGVRRVVVRRGRQYSYRLTPRRNGDLEIPAPTAVVGTEELRGRVVALRVIPPADQDVVLLEFSVDKDRVYPMQPFRLKLTLAVKDLPGEFAARDPLTVQSDPPVMQATWLDDQQMPAGIRADRSWREVLEPLASRRGNGVQINNIGNSSVFSLFESRATGFHPTPRRTRRQSAADVDTGYWEYAFERTLIPERLGQYAFSPVSVKGTFVTGMRSQRPVGERVFAVSSALTVTVQDVPPEGRPESYIGAIGQFSVRSELSPHSARVGDPMTLTLVVSGEGALAEARPPAIAGMAGVEGAFRMYEATEESQPKARRFTYSLRPLDTKITEFPAIPVSFFDVEQERYVTLHTAPIPLEISAAEQLADTEIVSAAGPEGITGATNLQLREGGIFANELEVLGNDRVRPEIWLRLWLGLVAGFIAVSLVITRVRQIRLQPDRQRRKAAYSRARTELKEARTHAQLQEHRAACECLSHAVTGLVADYTNDRQAGLAPRDVAERLAAIGVADEISQPVLDLLDQCDALRYGVAGEDVVRLVEDADALMESLVNALKRHRV